MPEALKLEQVCQSDRQTSVVQSVSQLVGQSVSRSVSRSVSQSISQSGKSLGGAMFRETQQSDGLYLTSRQQPTLQWKLTDQYRLRSPLNVSQTPL